MNNLAVITGASSGIGETLSIKMARIGYYVVLVARSNARLSAVSERIKLEGGKSIIIKTDLVNESEVSFLRDKVLGLGNVAVLINNAGFGKFDKIEDTDLKDWDNHININLRSAFLVSKAFVPCMKTKGCGIIVFINSVAGKKGYSSSTAYVASKYGMRGLADSLREELREDGVKVMSVFPGAVNTPFWDIAEVDFEKKEMLDVNVLCDSILHAIELPGNCVVEEVLIRRTKGDF